MSGSPCGPPQWPKGRGLLETPGRLVDVVDLMRSEWNYRKRASASSAKPAAPKP